MLAAPLDFRIPIHPDFYVNVFSFGPSKKEHTSSLVIEGRTAIPEFAGFTVVDTAAIIDVTWF
jgi:hypothetical protein